MKVRLAPLVVAVALPAILVPASAGARTAPCNSPKVRVGNFCVNFKTSNVRGFIQLAYIRVSGRAGRRLAVISAKLNGPFTAPCDGGPAYQAPSLYFYGGLSYNSALVYGSNFSLHQSVSSRGYEKHFTGRFISNTKAVVSWSETTTPSPGRKCKITATNVTV
jgi:hypothetical protein